MVVEVGWVVGHGVGAFFGAFANAHALLENGNRHIPSKNDGQLIVIFNCIQLLSAHNSILRMVISRQLSLR